ncbi:S1 RNA-binding domain-containing protein [Oceanirhabdus sp. W0125-5]|uniref:S1 RNA-binding domain-containing protein n=1 Tax=Oceanirhabdus sp. W0125-5 TaxID=2999116 RepID=UPI0022F2F1F0|nr:S1 RNA-binding domain-containing protein [Oceanirhabdus sp. W0125-5]WBW97940.1 S1 RNA-binding domain-containing protein [Oceanirhabdus sp. W0125-5]
MSLELGKIFEGKVVNITKFGAFVEVEGEIGLLHISEISDGYVKSVNDHLKENDKVKVKVISIKEDKISFSMKGLNEKKSVKPKEFNWNKKPEKVTAHNFEDNLSKFLKESEEKFKALKTQKNNRSNGYRRN